jgi:hypothetical protein
MELLIAIVSTSRLKSSTILKVRNFCPSIEGIAHEIHRPTAVGINGLQQWFWVYKRVTSLVLSPQIQLHLLIDPVHPFMVPGMPPQCPYFGKQLVEPITRIFLDQFGQQVNHISIISRFRLVIQAATTHSGTAAGSLFAGLMIFNYGKII